MNRSGIAFKRILTGALASAMILTATPSYAFAEELTEEPFVETDAAAEEVIETGAANEGDVAEEVDPVYNDELLENDPQLTVTLTGENCYITPGYNLEYISGQYKLSQIVEGVNATEFQFTASPAEHYAALTAENIEVNEGTVSLAEGTFTVSAPNGGFTGDITVTATAVPKKDTATVVITETAADKLTFTAGSGMTPVTGQNNKYTVSEVGNFTFTITGVTAHYTPVVKIGENTITPTVDAGTYTYTVNGSQYMWDFDIDVDVTQETRHTLSKSGDNSTIKVTKESDPVESDFVELSDANNKYYKGDVVYYMIVPDEHYYIDSVKIDDVEQTREPGKDYYMLTVGEADVTVSVAAEKLKKATVKPAEGITGVAVFAYTFEC